MFDTLDEKWLGGKGVADEVAREGEGGLIEEIAKEGSRRDDTSKASVDSSWEEDCIRYPSCGRTSPPSEGEDSGLQVKGCRATMLGFGFNSRSARQTYSNGGIL